MQLHKILAGKAFVSNIACKLAKQKETLPALERYCESLFVMELSQALSLWFRNALPKHEPPQKGTETGRKTAALAPTTGTHLNFAC